MFVNGISSENLLGIIPWIMLMQLRQPTNMVKLTQVF